MSLPSSTFNDVTLVTHEMSIGRMNHGGSIYSTKMSKCYKLVLVGERAVKHVTVHNCPQTIANILLPQFLIVHFRINFMVSSKFYVNKSSRELSRSKSKML